MRSSSKAAGRRCRPMRNSAARALPIVLNQCLYEMLNSANQAWTMYPGLSHGAYECLHAHGTDEQKATYLPKLTSGQWTGTMCLTEAHCGTDLGMLRSKAEPQRSRRQLQAQRPARSSSPPASTTWPQNIIHLVLARLPDAPQGSKGISLFVVPKFLPKADGTLGARNPIFCTAARAQDGHPRQRHRAVESRWRHRLAGGRAQQGLAGDVRDDERGPSGRGQPVTGPDRSGVSKRGGLRRRTASRCARCRARRRPTSRPIRSSCTPTCARCCSPRGPTPRAGVR